MERVRHLFKSNSGKTLLCFLVLAVILSLLGPSVALSENGEIDRQKIVHQVVDKWMQIGLEQYDRGYYKAAERSFLRAKSFEDHLDAAKRSQLEELLEKARIASDGVDRVETNLAQARLLLAEGNTAQARALLEVIKDSPYLSDEQKAEVQQYLTVGSDESTIRQVQIADLYNQSVDYYNTGQLEKARQGFLEVSLSGLMVAPQGGRAEDYLAKIDAELMKRAMKEGKPESAEITTGEKGLFEATDQTSVGIGLSSKTEPEITVALPVQPQEVTTTTKAEDGGYIEVIKQKQSILKSHAKAVVQDAMAKARSYIQENDFEQAKKALDYAQSIVNKNRLHLGEELFEQYSSQLQQQHRQVEDAQAAYTKDLAQQQRIKADVEQKRIRDDMEQARKTRIEELMENAKAYQKQQRYEEALGQLESLLKIDPLNDHALILKDTLTDTISFRRQLEVIKEREHERTKLLLETSKSEIPYANELVYPKNWLEISAKRAPEEAIGRDPETAAVYKQLDESVDLSALNRDMPLSDAIEVLRTSVDPPLKIFVNWRDLYDNADIEKTTPIDMDPISSIKLSAGLKLLLEAVSGGFADLGYGVESGIITIATEESIPSDMVTLVYDVSDLIGRPAEYRISQQTGRGGGGGGGVSDVGGGFDDSGQDEDLGSEEMRTQRTGRVGELILLIQDTVAPDSWFEVGGDGTVTQYGGKLLSVRQTAEIHNEISALLKELRKAQGYQIAIEARFLKVRENFLEDIGLDIDFLFNPGGKFSQISFAQKSFGLAAPLKTGVDGSLAGASADIVDRVVASTLSGGYGTILDDLQVAFLLNATQAHEDATLINAPKATVLSGESATFQSQKYLYYAGGIDVETRESTGTPPRTSFNLNYEDRSVNSGTTLNITPTIASDKKHVLLNIEVQLNDFLGFRSQFIDIPVVGDVGGGGGQLTIEFPETEVARVQTRVSVPDGATLLLGGQKLGAEIEKEAGVPILSKIPVLGRAFSNRSKVKDHKILLIMVKPTIILNEETEAEAVANLKKNF
ncbi:MAG: hypothetical protein JW804_05985 [Sedimentisphaerales bacterium]|nr:hypothetical protein [Sedimentisphaerales bacterium]